jgi:hypothetical protein
MVPDVNLFNEKAPGTASRMKPSWYIIANHHHTVHSELERFAVKRVGVGCRGVAAAGVSAGTRAAIA